MKRDFYSLHDTRLVTLEGYKHLWECAYPVVACMLPEEKSHEEIKIWTGVKEPKCPGRFAGDWNYPKRETVCIGFLIQLFCECFVELKIILPRSRLKSFFSQCAKLSLKINVAVVFLIIEAGHLLPSYIHILPKGFGTWKRFIAV